MKTQSISEQIGSAIVRAAAEILGSPEGDITRMARKALAGREAG